MTDLVARLKSPAVAFYEHSADQGALLKEAAAEIERLRKIDDCAWLVVHLYVSCAPKHRFEYALDALRDARERRE